jgi:hypothetical protein
VFDLQEDFLGLLGEIAPGELLAEQFFALGAGEGITDQRQLNLPFGDNYNSRNF